MLTKTFVIYRKQRAYENQCGVIDIFHEFFTSVVMKQFKLLFTGIADSVKSISSKCFDVLSTISSVNSVFVDNRYLANCQYGQLVYFILIKKERSIYFA